MRRHHWFLFLVCSLSAVSLVSACSNETSGPPALVPTTRDLQTDSTHYTLAHMYIYVATMGITFTNRTTQPFTFVSCTGSIASFHIEKLVDTAWVRPFSPTFGTCGSPPVVVPVGGQYSMSFKLNTPFPGTFGVPDYVLSEVPGTYRVVWDGDSTNGSSPLESRITNTFTLSVSP